MCWAMWARSWELNYASEWLGRSRSSSSESGNNQTSETSNHQTHTEQFQCSYFFFLALAFGSKPKCEGNLGAVAEAGEHPLEKANGNRDAVELMDSGLH